MTSHILVKFPSASDFCGYGFDMVTDRVVRFNKYPIGTYQNTRATYYINKKQFTHDELRKAALKFQSEKSDNSKNTSIKVNWKWIVSLVALVFIFSMSECSFNVNTSTSVIQEEHY